MPDRILFERYIAGIHIHFMLSINCIFVSTWIVDGHLLCYQFNIIKGFLGRDPLEIWESKFINEYKSK